MASQHACVCDAGRITRTIGQASPRRVQRKPERLIKPSMADNARLDNTPTTPDTTGRSAGQLHQAELCLGSASTALRVAVRQETALRQAECLQGRNSWAASRGWDGPAAGEARCSEGRSCRWSAGAWSRRKTCMRHADTSACLALAECIYSAIPWRALPAGASSDAPRAPGIRQWRRERSHDPGNRTHAPGAPRVAAKARAVRHGRT